MDDLRCTGPAEPRDTVTPMAAGTSSSSRAAVGGSVRGFRASWSALSRLLMATIDSCMRYRVTGLAAEAAFFAVLSLPPLIFGLAGTVGYVADWLGAQTVMEIREQILDLAGNVLTEDVVEDIIQPTLNDVLEGGGRADVISLGFLIALWSGSRALNVFVDTIAIMYGFGGHRGIVRTRALSFLLYIVALVVAIVLLPLVLAGPSFVQDVLPEGVAWLRHLYWPVVLSASVVFLTTLYYIAVPVRTTWASDLPGAVLCLAIWVAGAVVLRWVLSASTGSTSIYGPLAAPIAVLIWLYLIAIAVLIGAALNSSWDLMWPRLNGRRSAQKTS
jgi:membrane protein